MNMHQELNLILESLVSDKDIVEEATNLIEPLIEEVQDTTDSQEEEESS